MIIIIVWSGTVSNSIIVIMVPIMPIGMVYMKDLYVAANPFFSPLNIIANT